MKDDFFRIGLGECEFNKPFFALDGVVGQGGDDVHCLLDPIPEILFGGQVCNGEVDIEIGLHCAEGGMPIFVDTVFAELLGVCAGGRVKLAYRFINCCGQFRVIVIGPNVSATARIIHANCWGWLNSWRDGDNRLGRFNFVSWRSNILQRGKCRRRKKNDSDGPIPFVFHGYQFMPYFASASHQTGG